MAKRRPRAQVRKNRNRDGRDSWDWRRALGRGAEHGERFLSEEEDELRDNKRVLPPGARERAPRKPQQVQAAPHSADTREGEVEAFRGQVADVRVGDQLVSCHVRGRLETEDSEDRSILVVGDRVRISLLGNNEGAVEHVFARERVLVRADKRVKRFRHLIASHVDRVLLITSISQPKYRPGIVDRFLVAASSQELPAALVINKADLATSDRLRATLASAQHLYASIGIETIVTSASSGEGVEDLVALLKRGRTVLVGHSGVGKSSLLNAISPDLDLATSRVNRKTQKGTHTTSVARIYRLADGLEVIDTPGLRELEIIDLSPYDVEAHFPEFLPLLPSCEMDNCAHRDEPGCAVKAAVETGTVSQKRHQSYLDIRAELESLEQDHVY